MTAVYAGKRVLLTGHTGFKGAWLALWLSKLGAEVHGYALEEPGAPAAYTGLGVKNLLASDTRADLADLERLRGCYERVRPDVVFHMAAQPLVRSSYRNPLETLKTNFMGTAHVLEIMRENTTSRPVACVVVTSDKCYENRELDYGYRETDPMGGRDPYSMSKGACELLVASYRSSFFPPSELGRHGLALASACAVEKDLVASGNVKLDIARSAYTHVESARVYEDGDDTVIEGTIRRSEAGELLGHVAIEITGPDGKLIERHHIKPERPREEDPEFRLELPIRLPQGATVSLRYAE